MSNLEKLSANKLSAEIEKRSAADYAFVRALIQEGYGNVTGNELEAMISAGTAGKLVIDARKASHAYMEAVSELDRRRRYHGSDKPIKLINF